jgi:erythromycin esterase
MLSLKSSGQLIPVGSLDLNDSNTFRGINQILSSKQVIAVGEATHGSKEFIQIKSKLFIDLFRKHGFRDLAIEMPYSIGLELTDYINGLTSFAYIDSLLLPAKTLYSKEFFNLLNYLKIVNLQHSAGIRIHGIDIDQCYEYALNNIRKILTSKNNSCVEAFDSLTKDLPKDHRLAVINMELFTSKKTEAAIFSLDSYLIEMMQEFSSQEKYQIERSVEQLKDSYKFFTTNSLSRYKNRDKMMAGYVKQVLTIIPTEKLMIWAHNEHVRMDDASFQRMGEVLSKALGKKYFSIGSIFSEGSYRVYYKGSLQAMDLNEQNAGELAGYFKNVMAQPFFITASELPIALQNKKVRVHSVGIVQNLTIPKANKENINTTKDYDAYFYFPIVQALDRIVR